MPSLREIARQLRDYSVAMLHQILVCSQEVRSNWRAVFGVQPAGLPPPNLLGGKLHAVGARNSSLRGFKNSVPGFRNSVRHFQNAFRGAANHARRLQIHVPGDKFHVPGSATRVPRFPKQVRRLPIRVRHRQIRVPGWPTRTGVIVAGAQKKTEAQGSWRLPSISKQGLEGCLRLQAPAQDGRRWWDGL